MERDERIDCMVGAVIILTEIRHSKNLDRVDITKMRIKFNTMTDKEIDEWMNKITAEDVRFTYIYEGVRKTLEHLSSQNSVTNAYSKT